MNELTRTTLEQADRQLAELRQLIEEVEDEVQSAEWSAVSLADCLIALEEATWHLGAALPGKDEPSVPVAPMRDLGDIPNPNAQIAY